MRTKPARVLGVLSAIASVAIAGCGGGSSTVRDEPQQIGARPQQPRPAAAGVVGSGSSIADALQLCHANGGPQRTDYSYIASYRCPEGTTPLGGDPRAGAAARLGNVGAGPDGHVVDLYEIPCATPVRLYVDAYHCGPGLDVEIDVNRLTRPQLQSMASGIRSLHGDPSSPRALELRRDLLMWVMETQQLTIVLCDGLAPLLPQGDPHPYMGELALSLAAAVIEDGRDPADPVRTVTAALQGLLVYYQAIVAQEGPSARNPQLDGMLAMQQQGTLPQRVQAAIAGCDMGRLGVHFVR